MLTFAATATVVAASSPKYKPARVLAAAWGLGTAADAGVAKSLPAGRLLMLLLLLKCKSCKGGKAPSSSLLLLLLQAGDHQLTRRAAFEASLEEVDA